MSQPKTKNKSRFYVDNKKLYNDMLTNYCPRVEAWRAAGRPGDPPPATEFMGRAILNIAQGYCYSRKFYYLKNMHEELVSNACLIVLKYIHNFDPHKYRNPHAYITMLVHNAFLQFIKKETKNNKAKTGLIEKMYFEQMTSDNVEPDNFITYMQDKFDKEFMENKKFEDRNPE